VRGEREAAVKGRRERGKQRRRRERSRGEGRGEGRDERGEGRWEPKNEELLLACCHHCSWKIYGKHTIQTIRVPRVSHLMGYT
jgi:hypothetical protein